MDALWSVAGEIFTAAELGSFSVGEAFVLGSSFYVHDLGMALGATPEGVRELRGSQAYKSSSERAIRVLGSDEKSADIAALRIAARELHGPKASALVHSPMPGIGRFLIEPSEVRAHWGTAIGSVASSHHWSLREVDAKLGAPGRVPDARGGTMDLGFVACALRLIDFAHINKDRAPFLERMLRSNVETDSLKHWNAQECVTGPKRDGKQLVFGCSHPITSVDAWWTFFEMASGLDSEIVAVAEYLDQRSISKGRFSLEGVRGVKTPLSFSAYVQPAGFEPVDVRFRPDSLERLVQMLGGRTLYGDDFFAPLRELIQNARDALVLRRISERLAGLSGESGSVHISLTLHGDVARLIVSDDGVGMSARVITNYLLGVASDYWHSPDFYADYPGVGTNGFRPVGRFGIGFLSVFMMGRSVEVQTQRQAGRKLTLKLRGVGQRGSLIEAAGGIRSGTQVQIEFSKEEVPKYEALGDVVRGRAPMLEVPISVNRVGQVTTIEPGWWKTVSQEDFTKFIGQWRVGRGSQVDQAGPLEYLWHYGGRSFDLSKADKLDKWPRQQPEVVTENLRVLAIPGVERVLICVRGFTVDVVRISGMLGLVDLGDVEVDVARSGLIGWDEAKFRAETLGLLRSKILEALNGLRGENVTSRFKFLVGVADSYGLALLTETTLAWVTVVLPDGSAVMKSPTEVEHMVRDRRELIICYGAGLWSADRLSREVFPEASADVAILPINDADQAEAGSYEDKDQVVWGPVADHFFITHRGKYERAFLLRATLEIIARGWKMKVDDLERGRWCRKKQCLFTRLSRAGV
jgi:hypothetical protein